MMNNFIFSVNKILNFFFYFLAITRKWYVVAANTIFMLDIIIFL